MEFDFCILLSVATILLSDLEKSYSAIISMANNDYYTILIVSICTYTAAFFTVNEIVVYAEDTV